MIPLRDYRPSRTFPAVTVGLIVLNLLVFFYQGYLGSRDPVPNDAAPWEEHHLAAPGLDPASTGTSRLAQGLPHLYLMSRGDYIVTQYGLVPYEFLHQVDLPPLLPIWLPIWITLFTSMFLHGSLLHVLGNMLYLWIFGDNVEDAMGHVKFLLFYLVCGVAAALAQIAMSANSPIPQIGASGAIAGVLAAYFMLYPFSRILTLIPILFFIRLVAVPAVILLGIWFLLQVVSGIGTGASGGGVAWFAHVGGFLAGGVLVFLFRKRGIPVTLWQTVWRRRS
jgi:membrane associated rhomboid family serine protease